MRKKTQNKSTGSSKNVEKHIEGQNSGFRKKFGNFYPYLGSNMKQAEAQLGQGQVQLEFG